MYGEENIISAVIHVDETTPHLCDFITLTKRGNLSAKDVIGDKKMRKDARVCSKKGACASLHVWNRRKHNLTAWADFEKDDRVHQRRVETSYHGNEDYVEDQEIKLETEEQLDSLRKHWKRRERNRARERQVEKDEDSIVTGTLMDKEQRLMSV